MAHLRVAHLCVLQVPSGLLSEVSLKAVMVWIYGGAFTQGNAQQRLGSRKKVLFSMALPLRGEGGGDKGLAIKKNKIFWGIFVEFFVDVLSKCLALLVQGSSNEYTVPMDLLQEDVVVVTINYRHSHSESVMHSQKIR